MKKIKFRVWNSPYKMLYDIENVYQCLMQQLVFEGAESRYTTPFDHKSEGMVWMQFTGFTDRDGKEIYESDIVYFKANYTHKKAGWLEGVFIYDEKNYNKPSIKVGNDIYEVGEETDQFPHNCVVLGNIYEISIKNE